MFLDFFIMKDQRLDFFFLKESWSVFLWGSGISALVYLPYLVLPLFAIDDYFLYQLYDINSSTLGYNFYSTGRISQLVLADFFQLSNIQPLTKPFGPILFILSLSYLSVILAKAINLTNFWLKFAFSLLIILNPFSAELFHYSIVPAYSSISIFALAIGFVYGRRFSQHGSWQDICISIAMYMVSLSIYQIFYPIIFVFLLFQIAMTYPCSSEENAAINIFKQQLRAWIPYFLALIIYSIVLGIIFRLYPPQLAYPGTSFGEFIANLSKHEYWSALGRNLTNYLFKDNTFNSFKLNLLMWVFFTFSFMIFMYGKIIKCKSAIDATKLLATAAFLIAAAILGMLGSLGFSVLRPNEISGRSLAAFGVYQALTVSCGFILFQRTFILPRHVTFLSTIIIGVLIIGSAGRIGRIALDQSRLNTYDRSLAVRIVSRLESFSDFTPNAKLVILGAPNMGSLSRTALGDFNISALQHFSKVFVINEISGYSFQNPNGEDIKLASLLAQDSELWPNTGSVISSNGMFIVRLSK